MSRNVFIDMAHHPQVILDTMDEIESKMEQVEEKVSRTKRVRRMGCGWAFVLLALGAFLFVLDSMLGYGMLFAALGLALAIVAVVMIIAGIVAGARARGALGRFPAQEPQFAAVRQILRALLNCFVAIATDLRECGLGLGLCRSQRGRGSHFVATGGIKLDLG